MNKLVNLNNNETMSLKTQQQRAQRPPTNQPLIIPTFMNVNGHFNRFCRPTLPGKYTRSL